MQKHVLSDEEVQGLAGAYFASALRIAGLPAAPLSVVEERLRGCSGCVKWDMSGGGKCGECGCQGQKMLRMSASACPLGVWGAVKPVVIEDHVVQARPVRGEDGLIKGYMAVAPGGAAEAKGPGLATMAKTLVGSAAKFVAAGMPTVTGEQLERRLETCRGCEHWNARGFKGSGRCRLCGCSTQVKLRMATTECPVKKWGPVGG